MALLVKYGILSGNSNSFSRNNQTIKLIVSISFTKPSISTAKECVSISNIIRGGIDNELISTNFKIFGIILVWNLRWLSLNKGLLTTTNRKQKNLNSICI